MSQFFIILMAIQIQIACSYYCMLVIVFIYQILVWKTRIRFVTTSICHKTTSAAKWLDPHPLNFTFANYQIRFFLPQDQCQITGFWLSRPSTWKRWQHMNVFLILQKCQYCFQAEEKCVTVTYHGTVRFGSHGLLFLNSHYQPLFEGWFPPHMK